MELILFVLLALAIAVALYYRSKAKEFESLFELSKGYESEYRLKAPYSYITDKGTKYYRYIVMDKGPSIRLNKDGSIAKKRGPKAKK